MTMRSRIATGLSAIGAVALANKLAGTKPETLIVDEMSVPEVGKIAVVTDEVQTKESRATARRQTMLARFEAARPDRIRYFRSYKGGKHKRRVPAHIQAAYIDAADAKRERKNQRRALEHSHAQVQNPIWRAQQAT